MRRELTGKPRVSRHFLLPLAPTAEHESMKFPVFSLLAGNFGASETGSLVTAPSSGESRANLNRALPKSVPASADGVALLRPIDFGVDFAKRRRQ
jgi:hypothetical protein